MTKNKEMVTIQCFQNDDQQCHFWNFKGLIFKKFISGTLLTLRIPYRRRHLPPRTIIQECCRLWKNSGWDWFLHQRPALRAQAQQRQWLPLPEAAGWAGVRSMWSRLLRREFGVQLLYRLHLPVMSKQTRSISLRPWSIQTYSFN